MRGWFPLINKRTLPPPIFGSKVNGASFPIPVHCWPYTVLQKSRIAIIWLMWHVNFLLTLAYFSSMAFKPPLFIGLQFCLSELYTGLVEFFPQSFPESKPGLDFFLRALEKNRTFQAVGRNLKSAREGWRDARCSIFWKLLGMVFTYGCSNPAAICYVVFVLSCFSCNWMRNNNKAKNNNNKN